MVNEFQLKKLLESSEELNRKIEDYISKYILVKQEVDLEEIKGHIQKAKHNIQFTEDTLKQNYTDWALVGCYYAAYHIALALIMKKGFSSKSHDATLCVIIKEYYKNELDEEDMDLLNQTFLDSCDIMFYVQSKMEREKASYSSKILFDDKLINEIKIKTRLFLNKGLDILENE